MSRIRQAFISVKDNKNEKKTNKNKNKRKNITYNRISEYKCVIIVMIKKFDSLSFKSKYSYLLNFYDNLQKLIKIKPTKLCKIKEKGKVYNAVSELFNEIFEYYFDAYNELSDVKNYQKSKKFKPTSLKLKHYDYVGWFTKKENKLDDEEELDDLSRLEGDEEEVKEGKELKNLTPNKLLTRLPILLAQIKAGNNSYKLNNKIRQILLYLLYQRNKITKKVYNNVIKST